MVMIKDIIIELSLRDLSLIDTYLVNYHLWLQEKDLYPD